jgi:hypothetical protein
LSGESERDRPGVRDDGEGEEVLVRGRCETDKWDKARSLYSEGERGFSSITSINEDEGNILKGTG